MFYVVMALGISCTCLFHLVLYVIDMKRKEGILVQELRDQIGVLRQENEGLHNKLESPEYQQRALMRSLIVNSGELELEGSNPLHIFDDKGVNIGHKGGGVV